MNSKAKKKKTDGKGLAVLGRPTRYKKELDEVVYKLCLLKAIDTQIADVLGISEKTLNTWKEKHPTFLQSIKKGKDQADAEVAKMLFHRACGYSHPEDKFFSHPETTRIETGTGENKKVTVVTKHVMTTVPTTKHYPPDTAAACFWLKNRAGWKDVQDFHLRTKPYSDEKCDMIREMLARFINAKS